MIRNRVVSIINSALKPVDAMLVRRSVYEKNSNQELRPGGEGSFSDQGFAAATTSVQEGGKKLISSLSELDEILREIDRAALISDDAMRAMFDTFEMQAPDDLPKDPFSSEYKEYQLNLYQRIAGKSYQITNEYSNFIDVESSIHRPFPYYTNSWKTVSDHLMMTAIIIKQLQLDEGASVLEFGPGYGNTTHAMSAMGYKVTAVDIEQRFLDVIAARCQGLPQPPSLIKGDFLEVAQTLDQEFDAILFYESFHHSADHMSLLHALRARLKATGKVLFAAEPIANIFSMPWGVRLDGQSLWAIRNFGWLELGYTETYFHEALARTGWTVQKHTYPITDLGTIFEARKR